MNNKNLFVHLLIASLKHQRRNNDTFWQKKFNAIDFGKFFSGLMELTNTEDLFIKGKVLEWSNRIVGRNGHEQVPLLRAIVHISDAGILVQMSSVPMYMGEFWMDLAMDQIKDRKMAFLLSYASDNNINETSFLDVAELTDAVQSEEVIEGFTTSCLKVHFRYAKEDRRLLV